jgi:leucyl-tRNA synthetase
MNARAQARTRSLMLWVCALCARYPLDLRVSGKDLVTNHLTFFVYNHVVRMCA